MRTVGLIADDLTGACDSALAFLGGGPVRVGLWPCLPEGDLACAAVSTESREAAPETGYRRSREAAAALAGPAGLCFRKLDSMLRGHPVADVGGALDAVGGRCLVAPALPGEGRRTRDGVQTWPGGRCDVRALFAGLAQRVDVRDAATDPDLERLAQEALGRGDRLLAGTAGLAAALARALGLGPPPTAAPQACARPVAVVGSLAATAQAAGARARGWEVQVLAPGRLPDLDGRDGLLLTGGETATRVLRAGGVLSLELAGEVLPRVPLARARGGVLDGMPVALKAGAFGPPDAIHRVMEVLHGTP